MEHCKRLELFLYYLNGEGCPLVKKTLFLHNLPVELALPFVFHYDELQVIDGPLRSFIQHAVDTSFWHKSHAHTFCCSNHGS
jgi:hypothetical protein